MNTNFEDIKLQKSLEYEKNGVIVDVYMKISSSGI